MTPGDLSELISSVISRSASVTWADLPLGVRAATQQLAMDSLGVAAAGAGAPGVEAALRALAQTGGTGPVPVPWTSIRLPSSTAAMALSWLIHAWDFDDTHGSAVLHCGTVAVAAAYAVAMATDASGQRFLEGIVAGVETMGRLSLALGYQVGVVRTSGLASIGAAAAAARVLGLDATATEGAVALATSMAISPTSRQVVADSGETKRHQPGFGVRSGIDCAYLAAQGLTGAVGWFNGQFGLSARIADHAAAVTAASSEGWEIERLSLKPYPSCRFTHCSIAGALSLRSAVAPSSIRSIEVHVPAGVAHATVSRSWARRGTPLNDSQFSIPWMISAALLEGPPGLSTLKESNLASAEIESLARRVEVLRDVEPDAGGITPVTVCVLDSAGVSRVATVKVAPGSPQDPMTWDAIEKKVAGCLDFAGSPRAKAAQLRIAVHGLPESMTLSALTDL
ncbi:MAG: hypothetical protein JWM76_1033 [Pseudonocardiales bacterium]|nr:hypothetical protein [Pseudonocardiales bacterium]